MRRLLNVLHFCCSNVSCSEPAAPCSCSSCCAVRQCCNGRLWEGKKGFSNWLQFLLSSVRPPLPEESDLMEVNANLPALRGRAGELRLEWEEIKCLSLQQCTALALAVGKPLCV